MAGPKSISSASTSVKSGNSVSSARSGFKKLFNRRKNNAAPQLDEVGDSSTTTPKSLAAQRSERKRNKRWGGGGGDRNARGSLTQSSSKVEERDETVPQTDTMGSLEITSPRTRVQSPTPSEHSKDQQQSQPEPAPPVSNGQPKWHESLRDEEKRAVLLQKQMIKERDGFCRRVDSYDGQVIVVDGRPSYELGSYLGGGVAGVVYEGHRLRPMEEYPVRLGKAETSQNNHDANANADSPPGLIHVSNNFFGCVPSFAADQVKDTNDDSFTRGEPKNGSLLTIDSHNNSIITNGIDDPSIRPRKRTFKEEAALELTVNNDQLVIIDPPDAPSRSENYAKAVSQSAIQPLNDGDSAISYGLMEETVAIKVLNPVGFRTLATENIQNAVICRRGAALEPEVRAGLRPMEERHVWWLVNPNSRNLRTLQRYGANADPNTPRRVEVDRGAPDRGLRISLIAAYKEQDGQLKELPLTRCIEIWGHVPFGASDAEFRGLLKAIDAINAGLPPPPFPAFNDNILTSVPGRVGTENTGSTGPTDDASSMDESLKMQMPMVPKRTGIYRAATTARTTVHCQELSAYIALPAVPSKYIKWLRQRRAATKEIRNMMLIGRHRNIVHLFEVLELIQENKSTMFLILELVRGGELFDLISSNAAKISKHDIVPIGFTESETVMRKFFRELASGVRYCHSSGIAHRDLKPENLLVHNDRDGKCTLKIADFGLSAVFSVNGEVPPDDVTLAESYISSYVSAPPPPAEDPPSIAESDKPVSPMKQQVNKLLAAGGSALSFFTCGVVDETMTGACTINEENDNSPPSPFKRMTSVVGSPHYVAPEIISQQDKRTAKNNRDNTSGYDGTLADVWSAGVILYAMLFRSLPFGEDLIRCPRYQSFKKWYDEVKRISGCRRSSAAASLHPLISEQDERDMLGPHWFFPSKTSPESRDLIVAMLNPDPDQRPPIAMVLRHPWLLRER